MADEHKKLIALWRAMIDRDLEPVTIWIDPLSRQSLLADYDGARTNIEMAAQVGIKWRDISLTMKYLMEMPSLTSKMDDLVPPPPAVLTIECTNPKNGRTVYLDAPDNSPVWSGPDPTIYFVALPEDAPPSLPLPSLIERGRGMNGIETLTVTGLQQESERLERLIGETETAISDLRARLGQVREELQKRLRPSPEPRVSDHALLRYIERTMGVDIEAVKAEIMTPSIVTELKAGASAVTVKGVRMVAKEGVIVTVTTDAMKNAGKQKRQRAYEIDDEAA